MKKMMIVSATLLCATVPIKTNASGAPFPPEWLSIPYLVVTADVIGVGTLLPFYNDVGGRTIQVDTPLLNCTNQQPVIVRGINNSLADENFIPEGVGGSVFIAFTNLYGIASAGDWNLDVEQMWREDWTIDDPIPGMFQMHGDYSWFPVNTDNGLLFTHLTNVIHTLRTERNWTNYYEVVRNGVTSTSERVSNDSKHDLRELIKYADPAQLLFMKNDPLFPVGLKDLLPK